MVKLSQMSVFLSMYVGSRMWCTSSRNILRKRYLDAQLRLENIKGTKKWKRNIGSVGTHPPSYQHYFYVVPCTSRSFDTYPKIVQLLRLEGHVLVASFRNWCASDLDKPKNTHTHIKIYLQHCCNKWLKLPLSEFMCCVSATVFTSTFFYTFILLLKPKWDNALEHTFI